MKATLSVEFEPGEEHYARIGGAVRRILRVDIVKGSRLCRVLTQIGNAGPVPYQAVSVHMLPGEVRELLGLQP